jgi:hypothetical protein
MGYEAFPYQIGGGTVPAFLLWRWERPAFMHTGIAFLALLPEY